MRRSVVTIEVRLKQKGTLLGYPDGNKWHDLCTFASTRSVTTRQRWKSSYATVCDSVVQSVMGYRSTYHTKPTTVCTTVLRCVLRY